MTGSARLRPSLVLFSILLALFAATLHEVQGEADELDQELSEDKCRPYIEKALKSRETGTGDEDDDKERDVRETNDDDDDDEDSKIIPEGESPADAEESQENTEDSVENPEVDNDDEDGGSSKEETDKNEVTDSHKVEADAEGEVEESKEGEEAEDEGGEEQAEADSGENQSTEDAPKETDEDNEAEDTNDETIEEKEEESLEEAQEVEFGADESADDKTSGEDTNEAEEEVTEDTNEAEEEVTEDSNKAEEEVTEDTNEAEEEVTETVEEETETEENGENSMEVDAEGSLESEVEEENTEEKEDGDETEEPTNEGSMEEGNSAEKEEKEDKGDGENEGGDEVESEEKGEGEAEDSAEKTEEVTRDENSEEKQDEVQENSEEKVEEKSVETANESSEVQTEETIEEGEEEEEEEEKEEDEKSEETSAETMPEEELIQEIEIPENLRARDHVSQILRLDEENEEKEAAIEKAAEVILKDLKKLYETAIKPLETLYKYRDLSNRHFGDPEIFSKPLVLFMGPWSGGKSSIINYLLDIEYKTTALRTGAEPSPAYFNILMHGQEEQVLDGTQLAADWTFSGLQKFGQGMLDRLRGLKLNNKLLEKVNIVEIPGILEIRKQIQRLFPFNDACQWFIDRADIIFLVYDPSKLDVGPETEAILDQLKGREYQTRIILNKADQVKPEELMRVQGALIWNISPLMSSAEPPIMYSTSLWSMPYEIGAPTRLLYAQERAFLRDLRSAVDKRVEHKIASARRFAVRVRNHAKMVDCYLTTYYNHKSFFGSKKEISDKIIENPQDYHIYEGLSTLTNISRYDLPDPDVYRDFFRLNPLFEFPLLSSTCTYFRGCPINRLDVAIAYDLPELVGKYKKAVETVIHDTKTNEPQPS